MYRYLRYVMPSGDDQSCLVCGDDNACSSRVVCMVSLEISYAVNNVAVRLCIVKSSLVCQ